MPIFGASVTYNSKDEEEYYPNGQVKSTKHYKSVDGKFGLIAMATDLTSGGTGDDTMLAEVGIEVPSSLAASAGTIAELALRDSLTGDYFFPKDNLGNPIEWTPVA